MAHAIVTVRVRLRWWVKHYLAAVAVGCWISGRQPDEDRMAWWLRRGIWLEEVRAEFAA